MPLWYPERGACFFVARLPAFSLLPCPLSPSPRSQSALPRRGRGRPRLFHARGSAPCIPGVEPGRHRSRGANRALAGVCLRNRQLAAKPIEQPFYWRCRQPRRGGTGGDGTIRRKRRRRLRWSSPPGQSEQVPPGACLSCRPPTLTLVCFFAPIPPPPSPPGKGETFSFLMQGASPLASPGLDGARHWLDLR